MGHSDSEEEVENNDVFEFDGRSSEADDMDEDLFDANEDADEGTEHGDDSGSDEDDVDANGDEDEDEEEDEGGPGQKAVPMRDPGQTAGQQTVTFKQHPTNQLGGTVPPAQHPLDLYPPPNVNDSERLGTSSTPTTGTDPSTLLSPAASRRASILASINRTPRSYTVEAICAIAHPEPTHSLASTLCMSHLLTGSQDGYVRAYDVFAAANGKTFLTAPQRAHCGVVEGTMKAGQLRCWWANPAAPGGADTVVEDNTRAPVTSLAMHGDALWALAGTDKGHINLFTVRHEPGQFVTAMYGHRGPVSSLALAHDEMSYFSAGWDGDVYQWDLNTGQQIRKFTSTGAQVAVVAVRPLAPLLPPPSPAVLYTIAQNDEGGEEGGDGKEGGGGGEMDVKSEASYDPLFDDEPEEGGGKTKNTNNIASTSTTTAASNTANTNTNLPPRTPTAAAAATTTRTTATHYTRGPSVLDASTYSSFSPDVLMTASIDGSVVLWDRRVHSPGRGVGRLEMSSKTPPWCVSACWSADGGQIYAGRRNCTVDVWDTRQFSSASDPEINTTTTTTGAGGKLNTNANTGMVAGVPRLLRTLRNPISSGAVSCVAAFPDGRHIAVASNDNIRLWNASEADGGGGGSGGRSGVPFKIIPGHHGGIISQMVIDAAGRFMASASSNRGWSGESTRVVLVHDIKTNG